MEELIKLEQTGKNTIGVNLALQTLMEIINIMITFNQFKIFITISLGGLVLGGGIGDYCSNINYFELHLSN